MLFSPRAKHRDLAPLCRRVAIGLESGIDVRKIFLREAQGRAPFALRRQLEAIQVAVASGRSVADAFDAAGEFFPTLLRELVRVGEQTGHLDDVFLHLAEHYEYQVRVRREFMSSISWPLTQLSMALGLVGLIIWISGLLGGKDLKGREIDLLGFGLRGTSGVVTYFMILGGIGAGFFAVYQLMRRGALWARPIQRGVMRLPVVGAALETLAISRFAWTMHMTGESGMSLKKGLPLCLRATQNDRYISQTEPLLEAVKRGDTLTDAFTATGVFPTRFLDTFDVGERSGRVPETMKLLTAQYQDEARRAIKILIQAASWLVSLLVMGLVCYFIFRLAMMYVGTIQSAIDMK